MEFEEINRPENLQELFENKKFLDLLTTQLKNADKIDKKNLTKKIDETDVNNKKTNVSCSKIRSEKLFIQRLHDKIREFQKLIDNLNSFLRISLETFALHDDEPPLTFLARTSALKGQFISSPYSSRDAQILFTVKRIVTSLANDKIDGENVSLKISSINRLCVAGRALCRLIKCFTMRLSILDASSLAHLYQFSIIIDDLLRNFLEFCVRQSSIATSTKEFEKLVDNFQIEVVFGLKEKRNMLLTLLQQKMEQFLAGSDERKKKPKNFVYLKPNETPKGYLMPLHLREKRRKLQLKVPSVSPESRPKIDQKPSSSQGQRVDASSAPKKLHKLSINDRTIVEANVYSSKMVKRSEMNRLLFGLPIGTSTAHFSEKMTQDLIDEILDEFERDLSLACEDIVDKMYDIETKLLNKPF